ncbi:MAG: class I SAM-dependent methyltransferase family protein [Thermoplasmatota archaeon]
MRSPCIAVSRRDAERIRQQLLEQGMLRTDLEIECDDRYVYLPVSAPVDIPSGEMQRRDFEERMQPPGLQDLLADILPPDISLSSFDVIGDIAIVRIPDEALPQRAAIGDAILATHSSINVVCRDRGVRDAYRVRDVEVIAGEQRTETIHVEYGIEIAVDVAGVYFSPRLAAERKRVADQIAPGDVVIDMFAGAAPFSVLIARLARPSKVYAIDINDMAVSYARRNVQRNNVADVVEVIYGDAAEVVPRLGHADHVIMNLPHSADEFYPMAARAGRRIHYYDIVGRDSVDERLGWLVRTAASEGKTASIQRWRQVGTYSPVQIKIGVDLAIE